MANPKTPTLSRPNKALVPAVSTAYGRYLTNCILLNRPFEVKQHTTLNEKLNILASETLQLPSRSYPQMKYFCIGNGGHFAGQEGSVAVWEHHQHTAVDAAPFSLIPLVLREVDNDLPASIRSQYRLRRREEFNGEQYIAYYLKVLDLEKSKVEMELVNIEKEGDNQNRVRKSQPFVPTMANLDPVPNALSVSGVNVIAAQYIDVLNLITLNFSIDDAEEFRNVANIIYGTERAAMISEIGLVTGVDMDIDVSVPGSGNTRMTEVLAAQVSAHIQTEENAYQAQNKGFTVDIWMGSTLPMYQLEDDTTVPSVSP